MTVEAKRIHDNPSAEELRKFTEEMSNCRITEFDNLNVETGVTSRSAGSTETSIPDGCVRHRMMRCVAARKSSGLAVGMFTKACGFRSTSGNHVLCT